MTEPNLMPFQNEPFNGDIHICEQFLKLKEQFSITTAVETGSCLYSTTKWLGENFETVYTIELNPDFAKYGIHKVQSMQNVKPYLGDSVDILNVLIPKLKERCIFFLDAHWNDFCPLLEELVSISNIEVAPVIAIHDFYTGNPEFGYDEYKGNRFDWDFIAQHIALIEGKLSCEYTSYYNNIAVGAKRGIIYIHPKN